VQTDTSDQALDINEGSKLELGSTAKLRVLTTYLEIVAELHEKYAGKTPAELRAVKPDSRDRLSLWAVEYLAAAKDRSLPAMLQAALERRYSASPGEGFFTGGGVHTFNNFRHQDDGRQPTVREALQGSINLPFVRIMRDVVRHTIYQGPDNLSRLLEDEDDPRRQEYLARFADREGRFSCAASGTSTAARSPTRSAKTCSTTCAPASTACPRCSSICRRRPRPRRWASS
jgi:membrane peptidoglycan carboxypeptidase